MSEFTELGFVVDPSRSHVRIHTFAEGLLARLAHDLELVCGGLSGRASQTGEPGAPGGAASLEAPLRDIAVAGVLGKDGNVDERALSSSDRSDILAKMQKEVFHGAAGEVLRIEAKLDAGSAKVKLSVPNGRSVEVTMRPEVRAEGGGMRASGTFAISLASIGSDAVKGPMGAFRVKDRVAISFDVVFVPKGA